MPRYNPATIESKWQQYWEANRTFATPRLPRSRKLYVLDMFPYPSGDGLHVGHPEGYTATDIVCRYQRMLGADVMHPMGWDAFGLPAEQHAKKTGTPPRTTTEKNIANFRRQLKMLGFSYDWDRELATTDVDYFRWTQFIFLVLFDTWFDKSQGKGRPIAELPIPDDVAAGGGAAEGDDAIRRYRDEHRLAYQLEAPVNWCPDLGTVLANEEVIGGVSERGGHPVTRIPLRQWMLRITAYADRLEKDLDPLDWPEGIKTLQRNWIGRSTGADVDFFIGTFPGEEGKPSLKEYEGWRRDRAAAGLPKKPGDEVLRVYTTRPDTLFGATYMVVAPEHPFVERLTTPDRAKAVRDYCQQAARKSDLDRTDLAKEKTGEFTGSYAINPVNNEPIPIWVADYVLISYGTGAIMAVPAHDTRDFEFAQQFDLKIKCVVEPPTRAFIAQNVDIPDAYKMYYVWRKLVLQGRTVYTGEIPSLPDITIIKLYGGDTAIHSGQYDDLSTAEIKQKIAEDLAADGLGAAAVNYELRDWPFSRQPISQPRGGTAIDSGKYNGLPTAEFKQKIAEDLASGSLGAAAVNYKLRDWLFSRQHFWGEPFPILHELDAEGKPTGAIRAVPAEELPVDLPDVPSLQSGLDRPEPPLDAAPDDWLYVTLDGKRYKRETNTMPQWAGSCWYYLRFLDPKNDHALVDPEIEKAWMPVDLYVGGAEHAVLHLLYARFWHKVLYDRGLVSMSEPFQKLVNQGMILGEMEFTGYRHAGGDWVTAAEVVTSPEGTPVVKSSGEPVTAVRVEPEQVEKHGDVFVLKDDPAVKDTTIKIDSRAYKMSKSRGNVVNPDRVVTEYGADSLRLYEMFMGPLEAVKPWSMDGVSGVRGFLDRVWRMILDEQADEQADDSVRLNPAVEPIEPTAEQHRMIHKTIRAVTEDLDQMAFNTAIARMMEFTNFFLKENPRPRSAMETLVLLISPFAPHIAEELWRALGHDETLARAAWPRFDESLIREDTIEVPVQINGKLRARVRVAADADRDTLVAAAAANARIGELLEGRKILKQIVVPGRMVNFVVK